MRSGSNHIVKNIFFREIGVKKHHDALRAEALRKLKENFFSDENIEILHQHINFCDRTPVEPEFVHQFLEYSNRIFDNYGTPGLKFFFGEILSISNQIIFKIKNIIKNKVPNKIFQISEKITPIASGNADSSKINIGFNNTTTTFLDLISKDKVALLLYLSDLFALSKNETIKFEFNNTSSIFKKYHQNDTIIIYQNSQKIAGIYEMLFIWLNGQEDIRTQIHFMEQWFSIVNTIMQGKDYLLETKEVSYYQLLSRTIVNMSYMDKYLELIPENSEICRYKEAEIIKLKDQLRDFIFQEINKLYASMEYLLPQDKGSIASFLICHFDKIPKNNNDILKGIGAFLIQYLIPRIIPKNITINEKKAYLENFQKYLEDENFNTFANMIIALKYSQFDVDKKSLEFLDLKSLRNKINQIAENDMIDEDSEELKALKEQYEISKIILDQWKEGIKTYISELEQNFHMGMYNS